MKFLFFAAVFALAACSGDENQNNGTTNNGSNNGSNNQSNNETSNNGTSSNNGTASNNGTTGNNGTTVGTTSGSVVIKFSATATDFTSTQLFDAEVKIGETTTTDIKERSIASGDIGLALGDKYYFVLDRGAFGVHEGSIEIYNLDGTLDAKVDIKENVKDAIDVGDKIFVTSYQNGTVQVLKKEGGTWTFAAPIDLSRFNTGTPSDEDSDPEVDAIIANGTDVIVVLQMLTGFDSIQKSEVVIIDSETESVVDQIDGGGVDALELLNRNAFSGLVKLADDKLAIGSIGDFGAASEDAGIEILTKGANGLYTTRSYMTEVAFGLDLFSFLFTGEDKGYALTGFDSNLVAFENGAQLDLLPGDIESKGPTTISQIGDYLVVSFVNMEGAGFTVYEKESGDFVAEIPVTLTAGTTISNVVVTSIQ